MIADDTYIATQQAARGLHRAGDWDAALRILGDADRELSAEIAVDRWYFQVEQHDAAAEAVAALEPGTTTALLLTARLAYSRLMFEHDPRPDDREASEAAYRAVVEKAEAEGDEVTRGWAEFHWGVLPDNIDEDPAAALPHYEAALEVAQKLDDHGFLESYVIRHLAHLKEPAERIAMLRRSMHLRAALGARPQTLAAQAALAYELPEDDPERAMLIQTFRPGAEELRIPWLLSED